MDSVTRSELAAGEAIAVDKRLRDILDRGDEFRQHFSSLKNKLKAEVAPLKSDPSAKSPDALLIEGRDICVCVRVSS